MLRKGTLCCQGNVVNFDKTLEEMTEALDSRSKLVMTCDDCDELLKLVWGKG